MPNNNRYYNFMATIQCDYANANSITIDMLEDKVKSIKCDYVIILHDKDIGNNHYHIAIHLNENAKSISAISKKLDVASNFIQKWDERLENMWGYLPHLTSSAKNEKYNYLDYIECGDNNKYRSNISGLKDTIIENNKLAVVSTKKNKRDIVINSILDGDIHMCDMLKKDNLKYYYDNYDKVNRAFELRQKYIRLNPPNCNVIYITGKSGSGKSTQAIKTCEDLYGNNYVIGSSSNDLLQDYKDEQALIIDDFRAKDYPFIELLGLLDPYVRNRTHKSRYYNKALATETIIITSVDDIDKTLDYYAENNSGEDMLQLKRRIPNYWIIDRDLENNIKIDSYTYDIDTDMYLDEKPLFTL